MVWLYFWTNFAVAFGIGLALVAVITVGFGIFVLINGFMGWLVDLTIRNLEAELKKKEEMLQNTYGQRDQIQLELETWIRYLELLLKKHDVKFRKLSWYKNSYQYGSFYEDAQQEIEILSAEQEQEKAKTAQGELIIEGMND